MDASRDLLRGVGGEDGQGSRSCREQKPLLEKKIEGVELCLGLSLGGRFGLESKGERLARSTSVASVLAPLARTSSLPAKANAELGAGKKPVARLFEMQPAAANLPPSGSPTSDSSDGEGHTLAVNTGVALMRTGSLPMGIDDEWRNPKEARTRKRLDMKRKRIERKNSSNIPEESSGQIIEEVNAMTEKIESTDDISTSKQNRGFLNHSSDKRTSIGRPPMYRLPSALRGRPKRQNSAVKGTPNTEVPSESAVPPPTETESTENTVLATPPSSALAVRAATLVSRGEQQQPASGSLPARARSLGDAEREMMRSMPYVSLKGHTNGSKVEGFLYQYGKGVEVRIVCVCHRCFMSAAEFVKHAGAGEVDNPLQHIIVNPARRTWD